MTSSLGACARLVVALIHVVAVLAAQAPSAPGAEDPPAVHLDRLCVKLAEGSDAALREGRLHSRRGLDLSAVDRWFQTAHAEPLVSLSWDELDGLHQRACEVLPVGRRPGHLGLWFRLRAADAAAAAVLLESLHNEPLVETAYLEPIYYPASWHRAGIDAAAPTAAAPAAAGPATPLFTSLQISHQPTPVGHGVRAAAGTFGARGQNVGIRMIESSWVLGHEDVSQMVAANFVGPVPPFSQFTSNHGLSGGSIVFADRNGIGITGIADAASAKFLSLELNGAFEGAVALGTVNSAPGDVLLVILMVLVPGLGPGSWLPAEFYQSAFDASLTATANGRVLVVAGGNGNRSLDDPALLQRFDRTFRDSGAVLVAAAEGGLLQRASYSNWGSRIDAHSWGEDVVACGYGDLWFPNNDPLRAYTGNATGTSSATPHVAGVILSLQGAAKRQLGHALTNAEILAALHGYGADTPDVIGRKFDLVAAFKGLGIEDGLTVNGADVPLGGTIQVALDGPSPSILALFASFAAVDLNVGLNRNLHLDPGSLVSAGAFVIAGTPAAYSLLVPNTTSLQGADLFFQAVRLVGTAPLHLTNSCQVTIL